MKTLFLFILVALTPATVLIQNTEHNRNRQLEKDVVSLANSNGDSHTATYKIFNPVHIQNSTKKDNVSRLIKTNDNSPEIFYFGSWSESTNTSSFKNNHHLSDVQYANCVFTFNKTVVRWIGSKASNHGVADVYIDGVFQKSIDSYSDKELTNQVLFEKNIPNQCRPCLLTYIKGFRCQVSGIGWQALKPDT